jgi:hypothetical protein
MLSQNIITFITDNLLLLLNILLRIMKNIGITDASGTTTSVVISIIKVEEIIN